PSRAYIQPAFSLAPLGRPGIAVSGDTARQYRPAPPVASRTATGVCSAITGRSQPPEPAILTAPRAGQGPWTDAVPAPRPLDRQAGGASAGPIRRGRPPASSMYLRTVGPHLSHQLTSVRLEVRDMRRLLATVVMATVVGLPACAGGGGSNAEKVHASSS